MAEKVLQRPGVHGEHQLGIAGIGEDEPGVLDGGFFGGAGGGLFLHPLGKILCPALFGQNGSDSLIVGLGFLHGGQKLRLGLRLGGNLGGKHIVKVALPHIPLALDTVGGDAVAGKLGQEGAAHPLHPEGEGGVLDGAFVPQLPQHGQEGIGLFRGEVFHHGVDAGRAVAELGGSGNRFFRLRGVGDEGNFHRGPPKKSFRFWRFPRRQGIWVGPVLLQCGRAAPSFPLLCSVTGTGSSARSWRTHRQSLKIWDSGRFSENRIFRRDGWPGGCRCAPAIR